MAAKKALTASSAQPWDSNALAHLPVTNAFTKFINNPDDLVPGRDGKFWRGNFTLDEMQIRSTDSACADANANLSYLRLRNRDFFEFKRALFNRSRFFQSLSKHFQSANRSRMI
jgi:hypothetical protein